VLGFLAVLFAKVVDEQFARLFRRNLGESLEFADQVVALTRVLAGKVGGGFDFDFGGVDADFDFDGDSSVNFF